MAAAVEVAGGHPPVMGPQPELPGGPGGAAVAPPAAAAAAGAGAGAGWAAGHDIDMGQAPALAAGLGDAAAVAQAAEAAGAAASAFEAAQADMGEQMVGDTEQSHWSVVMRSQMQMALPTALKSAVSKERPEVLAELQMREGKSSWAILLGSNLGGLTWGMQQLFSVHVFTKRWPKKGCGTEQHGMLCAVQLLPSPGEPLPTEEWAWDTMSRSPAYHLKNNTLVLSEWDQEIPRKTREGARNFRVLACSGAGRLGGLGASEALHLAMAGACSMLYGIADLPEPITELLLVPEKGCRLEWHHEAATRGVETPAAGRALAAPLQGLRAA